MTQNTQIVSTSGQTSLSKLMALANNGFVDNPTELTMIEKAAMALANKGNKKIEKKIGKIGPGPFSGIPKPKQKYSTMPLSYGDVENFYRLDRIIKAMIDDRSASFNMGQQQVRDLHDWYTELNNRVGHDLFDRENYINSNFTLSSEYMSETEMLDFLSAKKMSQMSHVSNKMQYNPPLRKAPASKIYPTTPKSGEDPFAFNYKIKFPF